MATISEALAAAGELLENERLDAAVQLLQRIIDADPAQDRAWYLLAIVAIKRGQLQEAAVLFGRAIAINPMVADYFNNLGSLLAGTGRPAEAESCYRQVLDIAPESIVGRRNLSLAVQQRFRYPMFIPALRVQPELDFLLLELPPRNEGEMVPNGLGYVHNALVASGVRFQTIDLNVLLYHRFRQKRVLGQVSLVTAGGYRLKDDLWQVTAHAEWEREEVLGHFLAELSDCLGQIARERPKAVGLSVHASNRALARRFIARLRQAAPEVLVVVGGYDCSHAEIGPAVVPDFDYMTIFEADLTIGPLAAAIARGERPKDQPGIISRFDTPGRAFQPAPMLEDLDAVDFPRYQWAPPHLYGIPGTTVPITASRGCNWSRCRFCAECFPFRCRAPIKVADEIEQWTQRGCDIFHFYESDANADPQNLYGICAEVIRRGLHVRMSAQIRVDKRNTLDFFRHLRRAGFLQLRFGVDGWSDHVLALQRKGYTMDTVLANLQDCRASGIKVGVNAVVGVPGETEDDIEQTIVNLVRTKEFIDGLEFLNPLNLRCVSEFFRNSDQYKIRFRVDKDTLRREHPYFVPDDLWYSEEPYIDREVRVSRVMRIESALRASAVPLAPPVEWMLDRLRAGACVDGAGEPRPPS